MQNYNQLELEDKNKKLNEMLEEKEKIIQSTKEYLFVLEVENQKINDNFNEYKRSSKKEIKKLKKDYKKINKLKNKYEKKIKKQENTINKLKMEIDMIKSTFSWKITKPLRWIKRFF